MPTRAAQSENIVIQPVETETMVFHILGTSPLICNRMSEKAKQQLLMPPGRLTAADKASRLKHNPVEEFRASPYILTDGPTLIGVMASAFKGSCMTAALDMPGARRTQIGRLVRVEGEYASVWGEPHLMMSVTRSADIDKTPDVRSRAVLPEWCSVITVTFVKPMLNKQAIVNLLAAGGITAGVGDWRNEKGKGSYGGYKIVNADDPEFIRRLAFNREVQERMMTNPVAYDRETSDMLSWFDAEVQKKGLTPKKAA